MRQLTLRCHGNCRYYRIVSPGMIAAVISSVVNRPTCTCAYTGHVCARAKLYGRNVMLFLINTAAALSAVTDTTLQQLTHAVSAVLDSYELTRVYSYELIRVKRCSQL